MKNANFKDLTPIKVQLHRIENLYENIRNSLFFWHVSFNNENQLGS